MCRVFTPRTRPFRVSRWREPCPSAALSPRCPRVWGTRPCGLLAADAPVCRPGRVLACTAGVEGFGSFGAVPPGLPVACVLYAAMAGRERRCSRAADPASAGTPASRRVCSALTDVARLQAAPAGLPADCEIEHSRGPPGLSAELAGCACEAVPGRSPQTRPAACGGVPVPARAGCVAVTQAV